MSLDKMKCPSCGELLIPRNEIIKQSNSFDDCLRRCDNCMVGFSNGKDNPTMIYKNYVDNVPELLRPDLNFVLNNSLNLINRTNKKNKFAFSTSEDALTWSFFKYFVFKNRYQDLLKLLNIDSEDSNFDIYLWGTNICTQHIDSDLIRQFNQVSDSFNEDSKRRTEPDVIIKLSDKLIFIEVKYQSSNDVKTESEKFDKYLVPDIDFTQMTESGHYELYRNWAFATKLSNGLKFRLINLGMQRLFTDKNESQLKQFENSLHLNNGSFVKLSWEQIISNLNENEFDAWFIEYLKQKINASR